MPTPESSQESLAIRVAKLEAQNRRLKKAVIAALFIAMAVLTMGQAKPDRTIDVDSITAAKISARVIELREGSNTVKILLPGSIIVSEKDKANVNISTSDGPSLVLNDRMVLRPPWVSLPSSLLRQANRTKLPQRRLYCSGRIIRCFWRR